MHILIINDDGIQAPGIWHLWHALKDHAKLTIIAPSKQQSGKGLSITLEKPIHAQKYSWDESTPAWEIDGTPADCVKMALSVLLDSPPDMIVSGINKGCNSGRNVLYSGTVGGLIEGTFKQVPGIAFSAREFHQPNYRLFENYIPTIVDHFADHGIPKGTVINVNFPKGSPKGLKFARQGEGYWIEEHLGDQEGHHDFGAKWWHHDEHEDSDVTRLKEGFITAVPLYVHHLTHLEHFEKHAPLFNKLNEQLF